MIDDAKVVATPVLSISLFDRIWPVTGLAAAAITWLGLAFSGYGLFNLVELALS